MQKKQIYQRPVYGCEDDIKMIRNYFSTSGLDQMRALLALETFKMPVFHFLSE